MILFVSNSRINTSEMISILVVYKIVLRKLLKVFSFRLQLFFDEFIRMEKMVCYIQARTQIT